MRFKRPSDREATNGWGKLRTTPPPSTTLIFHGFSSQRSISPRRHVFRSAGTLLYGCASRKFTSRRACKQTVGIKEGKRSSDPRHFLRVGEGIEARRKAGKRPESLPKLGHYGGGGGGRRAKGAAGTERGLQPLPAR